MEKFKPWKYCVLLVVFFGILAYFEKSESNENSLRIRRRNEYFSNTEPSDNNLRAETSKTDRIKWTWNYPDGNCRGTITVDMKGGQLGNQLFKMAALFGVAMKNNLMPYYPPGYKRYEIMKGAFCTFPIPDGKCNNPPKEIRIAGNAGTEFNPSVFQLDSSKNYIMTGMLLSWKYFDEFREQLVNSIELCPEHRKKATEYFESNARTHNVSLDSLENVVIHARRDDFATKNKLRMGFIATDPEFITLAVEYVKKRIKPGKVPLFYVISDDIEWCRNNFQSLGEKFIFVDSRGASKADKTAGIHFDIGTTHMFTLH